MLEVSVPTLARQWIGRVEISPRDYFIRLIGGNAVSSSEERDNDDLCSNEPRFFRDLLRLTPGFHLDRTLTESPKYT